MEDTTARLDRIASFSRGPEDLRQRLAGIPREAWQYKPAPGKWSIHEVVIHLADSEVEGYLRCRRIIAESGTSVTSYDQDLWATHLHYEKQDNQLALDLFQALRRMTTAVLKNLPDDAWNRTIEHPEAGTLTLDDWLEIYDDHLHDHLRQITRNYTAWQASR